MSKEELLQTVKSSTSNVELDDEYEREFWDTEHEKMKIIRKFLLGSYGGAYKSAGLREETPEYFDGLLRDSSDSDSVRVERSEGGRKTEPEEENK